MADDTLELTIQVFNNGVRRYAHAIARTPDGPWGVNGAWLGMNARSAYEAIQIVLDRASVLANRMGPGRKPKGYWPCRFLCFSNGYGIAAVRPLARTAAGIPMAPTKTEMVERIRASVGDGLHQETAIAALEEVLDGVRSRKGVDHMTDFPVQGTGPS